ncbi:MAG: glycosyltransferase [Planctomycetes bacterium]|nr:glycosyltransferase [Planctomycetota bacterium]
MRIAMLAHANAPWTPHFARFFKQRGDDFLLITFAAPQLDGVEGVRIECVGREPYDPDARKHQFITEVPRVRRLLKDFRAEVVYAPYMRSNGLTAVLAARVPVVVSAVGTDVLNTSGRGGWGRRVIERILRFISDRSTIVHAVSPAIEAELVRVGADRRKILTFPYGVDLDQFPPGPDIPRPVARRLLCTRKHETIYDIGTILDSLTRLKKNGRDFHCTLAGGGSLLDTHRRRAEEAGLTDYVTFTGNLPHARLPGLLHESDVYISASLSDGTSVSLLEAIATGVFPVVSRIPANEPWIEDGRTGLLFEPGRADQLAAALETALDRLDLRQSAKTINRAKLEQEANLPRNMERLATVMERLAHGQAD